MNLLTSILPQTALNQNHTNTFTNNSSYFNGLQPELEKGSVITSESITYLEPHVAAKTLKTLICGFFNNPRQMAIKAAAGSGKTSSVIHCLNSGLAKDKEVHFYVPTLELGNELAQQIDDSAVIEGRKEKNCQRHEIAATLGNLGVPVYNSLCSSKVKDENGNVTVVNCPFYSECAYIKQFSQSKVKIMTHAFLAQNHGALETKADFVIIDERFFNLLIGSMSLMPVKDLFELDKLGKVKAPLMMALDALAQGQCTNLLSEFSIEARENLADDINKLLKTLDNKFDNKTLNPSMSDETIAFRVKNIRSHTKEISILKALLFELEQFELNPNTPTRLIRTAMSAEGIKLFSINFLKTDNRLNYFKRHKTPVLCIDASADLMILNNFFDDLEFHTIDVKRNAHVTQVTGSQYSKSRFFYNDDDGKNLDNLVTNLTKTTGNKKALVATYKDLETKLEGQLPNNIKTVHFNALRGIDKYKDYDTVFVVGRNQPPITSMEDIAAALFSRSNKPIQYNQEPVKIEGNYYSEDERVNAVIRQFRECEVLQAVDRLRLVHNLEKKEVVLVSNLILDIEVNRTVKQFKDLNESVEKKLSGITAECEGLLINSATFIHEHFGYLFKNFDQIKNQISRCKNTYRTFYMENYTLKFFRYVGHSGGHAITVYDTQGRSDTELIAALERVTGRKVVLVSNSNELTKEEITEILNDSLFINPRIFNEETFSVKVHVTQPEYFVRE